MTVPSEAPVRTAFLFLSLGSWTMGCGPSTDDTATLENETPNYREAGLFTPGTLESEMVGSTGETIRLQVWYPSTEEPGDGVRYDALWSGAATEGLTPDCSQQRPVLVFSHGWGGIRWQSAFLTEHLASHGYVVIAPDHTHNTFLDDDSAYFDTVVVRRPIDVADSFDWLLDQSANDSSSLADCVDPNGGFAISGHSFGGYTSFAVAGAGVHDPFSDKLLDLSDDRVWATLALAPWDVDDVLTTETMASVDTPVMTLSGKLDENTTWSQVTSLQEGLSVEPQYLGEFPNAGHSNFAPVACQIFTDEDGCGDEFIDEETFTTLVRTAGLVFLESIRGVDHALLQLPETNDELIWR